MTKLAVDHVADDESIERILETLGSIRHLASLDDLHGDEVTKVTSIRGIKSTLGIFNASGFFDPSRQEIEIDDFERGLTRKWYFNYASGKLLNTDFRHPREMIRQFARLVVDHGVELRLPEKTIAQFQGLTGSERVNEKMSVDEVAHLLAALAATVKVLARLPSSGRSILQQRIDWFSALFSLDPVEAELAGWLVRRLFSPRHDAALYMLSRENLHLGSIYPGHGGKALNVAECAVMLDLTTRQVIDIACNGKLAQVGLVRRLKKDSSNEIIFDYFETDGLLGKIIFSDAMTFEEVVKIINPAPGRSSLSMSDFAHLGEQTVDAASMVREASLRGEPGIGVILSGPVGTGKTEFAKVLAAEASLTPVFVGQSSDGGEPTRDERLSQLLLLAHLSDVCGGMLLVVDEAEDLFLGVDSSRPTERRGSKVFLNNRLETIKAPIVWITNQHPSAFGQSIVRRMSLHVEFSTASESLRRALAARIIGEAGIAIGADRMDEIVSSHVSPAVLSAGIRSAKLLGDVDRGMAAMKSVQEMLTGPRRRRKADGPYDLDLIRTDVDLKTMEGEILASGRLDFSMLLSGISGTGKSAFARQLAKKMDLEPVLVKASAILGSGVGETERNIAMLFGAAERYGQFLILDEVDSFLLDRGTANRSFEITQVNEMLTWLEDHPLPLVATTNLVHRMDQATRRRFDFKVVFQGLDEDQISRAFVRFFGFEPSKAVLKLDDVVPGDFAVVRRQMELRGIVDPKSIEELLVAEVSGKEKRLGSIGF